MARPTTSPTSKASHISPCLTRASCTTMTRTAPAPSIIRDSGEKPRRELLLPPPVVRRMRLGLSRAELLRVALLYAALGLVTLGGFFASSLIGRSYALLAGLGLVAYVFGLRHGLDADHIAAIDNVTRKLMQDGGRPTTVGFWFSLGHSTVVVALIVALVYATRAVLGAIPALQVMGAVAGTAISGIFLWTMGAINVVIVFEIYRIFR